MAFIAENSASGDNGPEPGDVESNGRPGVRCCCYAAAAVGEGRAELVPTLHVSRRGSAVRIWSVDSNVKVWGGDKVQ